MNGYRFPSASHCFLAGSLLLGAAAAHAASGVTVTQAQTSQVAPGMTAAQVVQALGRPARHIHYRNEPGPTYTYRLLDQEDTLFDVDFGADGKVASVSERSDEIGGGHAHGGR